MARTISINIADHNDGSTCTTSYLVQYKIAGDPAYSFSENYYTSPIILYGLQDSTDYEIYIQRQCCDGNFSTPDVFTYNTLPLSDNITGLAGIGGSESISVNWDDYTGADGYKMFISKTNDINTAVEVYDGTTSAYNATGLDSSTLYYIWVQAYTGDSYSDFATTSATTS